MTKEADKPKKVSITSIVNWITSHIWQSILIALALFLVPLIIVHFLYKWYTGVWILASTWSSGDLITYIAGFEAFLGTVVLGAIAVKQNEDANELNKRLLDVEEKSSLIARYPILEIQKGSLANGDFWEFASKDILICCSNAVADYLLDASKLNRGTYSFFTFQITNKSSSNVIITFKEASLYRRGSVSSPDYYKLLFPDVHPNGLDFPPSMTDYVGFLICVTTDLYGWLFDGKIELSVLNNASEKFEYVIAFSLFVDEELDQDSFGITNISRTQISLPL